MRNRVCVLNGPNLNLLGNREPSIYGKQTYADLKSYVEESAKTLGLVSTVYQSNHEGQLLDWIGQTESYDAILINPAAFGHTSVALLDALKACAKPAVEVHLSQIFKRESFRHHTHTSKAVLAVITGAGFQGYRFGLEFLRDVLSKES